MQPASGPGDVWQPARFDIVLALRRTLDVFLRHAPAFLTINAVCQLPALATNIATLGAPPQVSAGLLWSIFWSLLAASLATAMTVSAAVQDLLGQPIRIGHSINLGFGHLVPVLLTGLSIAIFAAVGAALFVIPGVMIFVACVCAIPVSVVERRGPIQSIKRSFALTKGHRWGIFGAVAVTFVLQCVCDELVSTGSKAFDNHLLAEAILQFGVSVIIGTYNMLLNVIIYHDIRVAVEGVDSGQIAAEMRI
jgi:hypothetical protein